MKRQRISIILAIIITYVCSGVSAEADNVVITGETPTMPDGAVVHLYQIDGHLGSSIASDSIADGKFKLSVSVDSLLRRMDVTIIQDDGFNMTRKIYVRAGAEILINGNDDLSETWEVTSNIPEQAEYDRYIFASKDILKTLQRLMDDNIRREQSARDKETWTKAREEYEATKAYRDSLEHVVAMRDIEIMRSTQVTQVWLDKLEERVNDLRFTWNDTVDAAMKEFYSGLDDSFKSSRQGKRIGGLLYPEPLIEVGDSFPDILFHDLNGQGHRIYETRGKWTIVALWTIGCMGAHYAVQEMPKLLERHQGDLEGVLLSIDSEETWRFASDYLKVPGNNWNEGMEDMGLYRRFGAMGTPIVVMVSPDGSIADIFLGFYTDRIEENLNKKHNE